MHSRQSLQNGRVSASCICSGPRMFAVRSSAARQLARLCAGPQCGAKAVAALDAVAVKQHMSSGPKTATPPPNAARGATADLCDIYITDPVDVVSQRNVQIMEPIFRFLISTFHSS